MFSSCARDLCLTLTYHFDLDSLQRKDKVTSDEEHDEFVADGISVDRTAIESFVFQTHFAHLQVPLVDVRSYQTEPRVVYDPTIFVRQRKRFLIEPRHLEHTSPASEPTG